MTITAHVLFRGIYWEQWQDIMKTKTIKTSRHADHCLHNPWWYWWIINFETWKCLTTGNIYGCTQPPWSDIMRYRVHTAAVKQRLGFFTLSSRRNAFCRRHCHGLYNVIVILRLTFHRDVFPVVQLVIRYYLCRKWLATEKATCYYLYQWRRNCRRICASLDLSVLWTYPGDAISESIIASYPYLPSESTYYVRLSWASYQIRKTAGCACAGNAGNVFPAADFKGNRQLAIPVCITTRALRTCRDACQDRLTAVAGKTFPEFPAHGHPANSLIWQEAHEDAISMAYDFAVYYFIHMNNSGT